ncbi:MAG: (4Fe-4S)-binding protein [Eubacteriales bacterium]
MEEKELLELGYKKYAGKDLDVFFNRNICRHSGYCVGNHSQVFNIKRKPWILTDGATVDSIVKTIDNCPSGALKYILKK